MGHRQGSAVVGYSGTRAVAGLPVLDDVFAQRQVPLVSDVAAEEPVGRVRLPVRHRHARDDHRGGEAQLGVRLYVEHARGGGRRLLIDFRGARTVARDGQALLDDERTEGEVVRAGGKRDRVRRARRRGQAVLHVDELPERALAARRHAGASNIGGESHLVSRRLGVGGTDQADDQGTREQPRAATPESLRDHRSSCQRRSCASHPMVPSVTPQVAARFPAAADATLPSPMPQVNNPCRNRTRPALHMDASSDGAWPDIFGRRGGRWSCG